MCFLRSRTGFAWFTANAHHYCQQTLHSVIEPYLTVALVSHCVYMTVSRSVTCISYKTRRVVRVLAFHHRNSGPSFPTPCQISAQRHYDTTLISGQPFFRSAASPRSPPLSTTTQHSLRPTLPLSHSHHIHSFSPRHRRANTARSGCSYWLLRSCLRASVFRDWSLPILN